MENLNIELVKQKLLELLSHMGMDAEIYERAEEGRTVLNLRTRDSKLLIGKQGANLDALQYVLRLLLRKDSNATEERLSFALDVDDYKDQRTIYLKEMARQAAHQAKESRRSVALPPMTPTERRVVHSYLSLYNDLASESIGQEPNRRVVIRFKSEPKSDDPFKFVENL